MAKKQARKLCAATEYDYSKPCILLDTLTALDNERIGTTPDSNPEASQDALSKTKE